MDTFSERCILLLLFKCFIDSGSCIAICEKFGGKKPQTIELCTNKCVTSNSVSIRSDGSRDKVNIDCWCTVERWYDDSSYDPIIKVRKYNSTIFNINPYQIQWLNNSQPFRFKTTVDIIQTGNVTTRSQMRLGFTVKGFKDILRVACNVVELKASPQNEICTDCQDSTDSTKSIRPESESPKDKDSLADEPIEMNKDVNTTSHIEENSDQISVKKETVVGVSCGILIVGSVLGLLLCLAIQWIRKPATINKNGLELTERPSNTALARPNPSNYLHAIDCPQIMNHCQQIETEDPRGGVTEHVYESIY